LITGDTFWEPVIGSKPVNRLTGYRFTSLVGGTLSLTQSINHVDIVLLWFMQLRRWW